VTETGEHAAPPKGVLRWLLDVERAELPALAWSFAYFFCLLCGYYVLRPIRDAFGSEYPLRWLFLATFLTLLVLTPPYGALVARFPRRVFLPIVYLAFIACLGVFYLLMLRADELRWFGAVFFVWVAVFNVFAVSVFWSFMADIFTNVQSKRFYGTVAAGGTIGAMLGPTLTVLLVDSVGIANMLLVSAGFLGLCLVAILRLVPWALARERERGWVAGEDAIGGSILGGARLILESPFLKAMCLLMFLGISLGTLLYNEQQAYARIAFPDDDVRAGYFATLDLIINVTVLITQLTITRYVLTHFGPAPLLLVMPLALGIGFASLSGSPFPILLSAVQIATRAGEFAMSKPARETFYTRVDRESRYKSKNFIDTVVYRGGDLTFSWLHAGLTQALGFGTAGIAAVGVAMSGLFGFAAWLVIRRGRELPPDADDHTARAE
jgi:AAA family ATP:ADP antiporter